ncbi:serine carboxypeptidase S28-domain-containing protein [Xylariaceae sp. FL0255]|nr:serine carboxypeptidase S28-domain-containing protein [Xylariaceae sp. FL0255]
MLGFNGIIGLLALTSTAKGLRRSSQPISELKKQIRGASTTLVTAQSDPAPFYPQYTLSIPVDHFHNDSLYVPHSNDSFENRYWFDATYYKPGGPVIVLMGGEDDGTDRWPFLQKGIVYELAKAHGGLGVILEHRYYGTSIPTKDLSTESLRFLTTDQALADAAYFAKNVKFAGLEDCDLSPETTPWIAYGGSYAGAFVAFLRKLYPDVYYGAISSSGVPAAIWDYWQYYNAATNFGPQPCVSITQKVTDIIDGIILRQDNSTYVKQLKTLFGLPNVTHITDFANTVTGGGLTLLQDYNWDLTSSGASDEFFTYCDIVSSPNVTYPKTESLRGTVTELMRVAGYGHEIDTLTNHVLNFVGYTLNGTASCTNEDQDECYGTYNATFYAQDDLTQTWRTWPYQVCTQWGFLQTGSGVPRNQLPLISRVIDLEYTSIQCRDAFNLTKPADVDAINKYGAFNISYPRLAFLDGQWDPWRDAGVNVVGIPERNSTTSEPYILIAKAVHHWDENGLFPNETTPQLPPPPVANAHHQEAVFVGEWLKDFKDEKWSTSKRKS